MTYDTYREDRNSKVGFTDYLHCPHCSSTWWAVKRRPVRGKAPRLYVCLECGSEFRAAALEQLGGWVDGGVITEGVTFTVVGGTDD